MTKIPNFICIFISLIALCSWVNHTNKPLKQAEWLVGTWKNETKRGIVYETWRKVSKTELVGKSYKIKQGDTVVFETIRVPSVSNRFSAL